MENKLITIAIRRVEQASTLKQALAKCGISSFIHKVSEDQQGFVFEGVRVRIDEKDLSKALLVMDMLEKNPNEAFEGINLSENRAEPTILVPVDFSEHMLTVCFTAVLLAHHMQVSVSFLHAYLVYAPFYMVGSTTLAASEEMRKQMSQVNADMQNLDKLLKQAMERGELPSVKYTQTIKEGIPENVIIDMTKKQKPLLVVMGTRGKNKKEEDLIGSVTAEVIEHCKSPVLAIPESVNMDISKVQNVLFATNFDEKTLLSLDNMMLLLNNFKFKLTIVHINSKLDNWGEMKFNDIKFYLSKQYPEASISYEFISDDDKLQGLDQFITQQQIDIIALNTHKRNLFARLFNPTMARKMVFHANTPILVFHT